jgi:HEAT repeat protein
VKCSSCKFLNPDDNKFCINCGTPIEQDSSAGAIDFSDVIGSNDQSLTSEQEDLLKDLDGLSMSTPDMGSASANHEDIDLLLSDFEGTISSIMPADDFFGDHEQNNAGTVTQMITPKRHSEDDFFTDDSDSQGQQPFDFFETDLSSIVDTKAPKSSNSEKGAVTQMILPGDESELFGGADDDIDSSGFMEGQATDVPDEQFLFESGIFQAGSDSGIFEPNPVPQTSTVAAVSRPDSHGSNDGQIVMDDGDFDNISGDELDSLLAEIGGVVDSSSSNNHFSDSDDPFASFNLSADDGLNSGKEVFEVGGMTGENEEDFLRDLSSSNSGLFSEEESLTGELNEIVGGSDLKESGDSFIENFAVSGEQKVVPLNQFNAADDGFVSEFVADIDSPMDGKSRRLHNSVCDLDDFLNELEVSGGNDSIELVSDDQNDFESNSGNLVGADELVIEESGFDPLGYESSPFAENAHEAAGSFYTPDSSDYYGIEELPIQDPAVFGMNPLPNDGMDSLQDASQHLGIQCISDSGKPAGQFVQTEASQMPQGNQQIPQGMPQMPQGMPQMPQGTDPNMMTPPWWAFYMAQQQAQQGNPQGTVSAGMPAGAYPPPWFFGYPTSGADGTPQFPGYPPYPGMPGTPLGVSSSDAGADEIENILGALENDDSSNSDNSNLDNSNESQSQADGHPVQSAALEDFLSEISIDETPVPSVKAPVIESYDPMENGSVSSGSRNSSGLSLARKSTRPIVATPIVDDSETPEKLLRDFEETKDDDSRYQIVQKLGCFLDPSTVPLYIKLLGDQNSEIRECAVETLGNLGSSSAVRPLMRTLGVESQNMRYLCAEALGKIGDPEALDTILVLLNEDDDNLRYIAAEAVGRIGSERGIRALVALAADADKDLRYIIARSLGQIGSVEGSQLLLRFLDDDDPEVVISAINAMGEIRDPDTAVQLVGLIGIGNDQERLKAIVSALGKIRSIQAVPHLIKLLASSSEELATEVIRALGIMGDKRAVEPIVDKLSPNLGEIVQQAAIEALGALEAHEAIPSLVQILNSGKSDLKTPIARALGQIKTIDAMEPLGELLQDADVTVRKAAASGLGNIELGQALRKLSVTVSDPDEGVRRETAYAIGRIGTDEAIPLLVELLQDSDEEVSQRSVQGLKNIGQAVVEPLVNLLLIESTTDEIRIKIVQVLGQLADIKSVNTLLALLDDSSPKVRDEIFTALIQIDTDIISSGDISVLMKESYAWMRYGIARAMGRYNRTESVSLILKILSTSFSADDMRSLSAFPISGVSTLTYAALDIIKASCGELLGELNLEGTVRSVLEVLIGASEDTRHWLIYSLGFIQKEASIVALVELLKKDDLDSEEENIAKALRRIKMRTVAEKLLEAIPSANARNRRKIAEAMGILADTRTIKKLRDMLRDPDEAVRLASLVAVAKIGSIEAFAGISESVKDSSERIRRTAVEVLGKMPDERAISVLGTALHDRSSSVRVAAAAALGANRSKNTFPILIAGLKDESSDVRCSIVKTLGDLGKGESVEKLMPMLKDINSQVRHETVRALGKIGDASCVPALLQAMSDNDLWVKTEASKTLRTLGLIGLSNLVEALGHPLPEIQRHAVEVLDYLPSPQLNKLLTTALKNRSKALRANAGEVLGRIKEKNAVLPLMGLLDDRDYEVRERVAQALGEIGDISASIALKQAMKDQNRMVRTAASRALKKIMEVNRIS